MSEALSAVYPWLKAFHIIAVVAWMAGLLYLPRLFVYHADSPAGSLQSETFKTMERRLLHGIMVPAATATIVLGGMLAATPGIVDWSAGWIWAKLVLVAALIIFHLLLARWRREFAADRNRHTARFFRIINELPTIALLGIVVLVTVKPF
ncbi:MAG TPA: protoporphyrinogen oxidase HemJ [Stellaceae bacterium]|nr:protoporphyrinogen oxidase HemJ [Stellaceae bacterium]